LHFLAAVTVAAESKKDTSHDDGSCRDSFIDERFDAIARRIGKRKR